MTIRRLYILALCATVALAVAGQAVSAENTQKRHQRFDLVDSDESDATYGTFESIGGTGGSGPYGEYVAESPGEAVTHAAPEVAATWTTVYVRHREVIRPFDAAHVPEQLDDAPLSKIDLPDLDTPDDASPEDEIDIVALLGLGGTAPQDDSPVRFRDFFPSAISALIVALLGGLLGLGITYWRITHGGVQEPRKTPRVVK